MPKKSRSGLLSRDFSQRTSRTWTSPSCNNRCGVFTQEASKAAYGEFEKGLLSYIEQRTKLAPKFREARLPVAEVALARG